MSEKSLSKKFSIGLNLTPDENDNRKLLEDYHQSFCGSRLRPKRMALRSKAASTTEYDSKPFTRAILLGGLFVWG